MKGFLREFKRINWRGTFFGSFKRTVITGALFIPLLVGGVAFAYWNYENQQPAVVYAHKLQAMTQQVNKVITLPKDEQPLVATVTDATSLPKEQFFSYAQNGDKIFMYRQHKLAVLYRQATKQVVTEAVLDFSDFMPSPTGAGQQVAGAATAATPSAVSAAPAVSPTTASPSGPQPTASYHPKGKVLVQPQ